MDKPEYRVPLMAEIGQVPWNGLTLASTFSGGGGSCTGYRMAGYRVLWANDMEPTAQETYRLNHPGTILDPRDIRKVSGGDILEAVGPVDVLDGSPPCQSFSPAGIRARSWGREMLHSDGTFQRSDDLFFEFARVLGELRPRAFIAENVAGLVRGVAKGYFKRIVAALAEQGYTVEARLLDAQWLGVPQHRERVFIVGVRDDLGLRPAFPSPLPYRYSIADACPWLRRMGYDGGTGYGRPQRVGGGEPCPTVEARGIFGDDNSFGGKDKYWVEAELEKDTSGTGRFAPVQTYGVDRPAMTVVADTPAHYTVVEHRKHHAYAKQASVDEPSPTVLASDLGWSDIAVERRKLTIPEVVRLCSFPDDYVLTGSYARQWARLGNSVPPLMARAVGAALAGVLAPQPAEA